MTSMAIDWLFNLKGIVPNTHATNTKVPHSTLEQAY